MIRVVMTKDEIVEACQRWLADKGFEAPADLAKLKLAQSIKNDHNGNAMSRIELTVEVEADRFGGPYR